MFLIKRACRAKWGVCLGPKHFWGKRKNARNQRFEESRFWSSHSVFKEKSTQPKNRWNECFKPKNRTSLQLKPQTRGHVCTRKTAEKHTKIHLFLQETGYRGHNFKKLEGFITLTLWNWSVGNLRNWILWAHEIHNFCINLSPKVPKVIWRGFSFDNLQYSRSVCLAMMLWNQG